MRIALDYDDTITRDETLWRAFIDLAKTRGHSVAIVTSRSPDYENSDLELFARAMNLGIVYASHKPKRLAYEADVWIDDMPETIVP